MASFMPRGFLAPDLRQCLSPRSLIVNTRSSQMRTLRTSPLLRALRKPASSPAAVAKSAASRSASKTAQKTAPETPYALLKNLALKTSPTVLYEGPSHTWFYAGCWATGISLVSWTLLVGPGVVLHPLPDAPVWVNIPSAFAFVFIFSIGGVILLRTRNIVKRIRIVPRAIGQQAAKTVEATPKTSAAAMRPSAQSLELEVTVKGMIPAMHSRVLRTPLEQAQLQSKFSLPDAYVPRLRKMEMEKAAEEERRVRRDYDMNHIMTIPFRHLKRGLRSMYNGFYTAMTDKGFGILLVNGKQLKVDVTNGYAHDGFKTLERLVDIKI